MLRPFASVPATAPPATSSEELRMKARREVLTGCFPEAGLLGFMGVFVGKGWGVGSQAGIAREGCLVQTVSIPGGEGKFNQAREGGKRNVWLCCASPSLLKTVQQRAIGRLARLRRVVPKPTTQPHVALAPIVVIPRTQMSSAFFPASAAASNERSLRARAISRGDGAAIDRFPKARPASPDARC